MNLTLTRKPDCAVSIEILDRCAFDPFHCQAGSLTGLKFSLKVFEELVRRFKEISIEPFEAAVDLLIGCDFFNAINRSTVTLCGHARAIFAMIFLEIVIPIVERIHQMGGGAAGHTPTD